MTSADHLHHAPRRSRALFALIGCTFGLVACQGEQDFTRQPAQSVTQKAVAPIQTTVFVSDAIPLSDMVSALDERLPNRLTAVSRRLSRAACIERNGRTRCRTARVTGNIVRNGPPQLIGSATGLTLAIPAEFTLRARGTGAARAITAETRGNLIVNADFDITLDENWQHQVTFRAPARLTGTHTPKLLNREIELDASFARGFTRRMTGLRRTIATRLNATSLASRIDSAWRNLHYPVLLTSQPRKWLRGDPQSLAFGGIAADREALNTRIAVRGRLAIYDAERPVPLIARQRPALSRVETRNSRGLDDAATVQLPHTKLVVPVILPYVEIAGRIEAALKADGPITETVAGKNVQIAIEGVTLFPSNGRITIALKLVIRTEGAWQDLSGTAYLMGTPGIMPKTGRLGLRFVEFTAPRPTPALFDAGRFILPQDTFVAAAKAGFDVDLKQRFSNVLPDLNRLMNVPFAEQYRLGGQFSDLGIHAVTPSTDDLRIALTAKGALSVEAPRPTLVDLEERETVSTSQ